MENHANDYFKRKITNSDYKAFADWVKCNHSNIFNKQNNGAENAAFAYTVRKDDFPENTEPTSVSRCIDMIIFGSGELQSNSDGSNYIKTNWQFGISVIAPIEPSQTRFMEVLTKDKLDKTQNLLGFKCYGNFDELREAFKGLNQNERKHYDNIKFGQSKRLIDIQPWKEWWEAVEGKKEGQSQTTVHIGSVENMEFGKGATFINTGVINDNSVRIEKLMTQPQFENDELQKETIFLIQELNKKINKLQSDKEKIASSLSNEVLPEIENWDKADKGKLKKFFLQLPEKVTYYGAPIVKIANELVALWTKLV